MQRRAQEIHFGQSPAVSHALAQHSRWISLERPKLRVELSPIFAWHWELAKSKLLRPSTAHLPSDIGVASSRARTWGPGIGP
jgi:hypothetical protein